ncbi:MAG: segregation/condensation protein A [Parcubacteria group bacterium]
MAYEIETTGFKGPIQKLLEFIEDKKYEITEINLAKITGDFLDYLKIVENDEPRLLADFIAVAAKLILIKSRTLIPDFELTPEEEEGIKDLERRLIIYKSLKDAEENFLSLWKKNRISFAKDPTPLEQNPVFIPSSEISLPSLLASIAAMRSSITALKTQYEDYEPLNFEAYVSELITRIGKSVSKFGSVAENRNKNEVIVLFLALLHLLKDNKVSISQDSPFSEITITPNG